MYPSNYIQWNLEILEPAILLLYKEIVLFHGKKFHIINIAKYLELYHFSMNTMHYITSNLCFTDTQIISFIFQRGRFLSFNVSSSQLPFLVNVFTCH